MDLSEVDDGLVDEVADLRRLNEQLGQRVAELEEGLAQERRLHRRVAELTDLVQEVLLPAPRRNDGRIAALLKQYRDGM